MDGSELMVGERLARIEVKLDQVLNTDTDHETRIRALERVWLKAAGAAAVVSAAVSAAAVLAASFIH